MTCEILVIILYYIYLLFMFYLFSNKQNRKMLALN
jgi:hypothetical protein